MYCEKCGAQNPEDAGFCAECGSKIEAPVVPKINPQVEEPSQEPNVPTKKPLSKVTMGVMIALIVVIVLAIAWVLWDIYSITKEGDGEGATPTVTVEPTVKATPTMQPTVEPTATPTVQPTSTIAPTVAPTIEPTEAPVVVPTIEPEQELEIMPSNPSQGEPSEILQIRAWFQATENSLSSLDKVTSGGMTRYRDDNGIVKIRLEAGYNAGAPTIFINYAREFFYHDNQLYFVHILSNDEGGVAGDRFYFVDGKIIRFSSHDDENFYNNDILSYMSWAIDAQVEGAHAFGEGNTW